MPNDWHEVMATRGWRGALFYAFVEGREEGTPPTSDDMEWLRYTYGIEYDLLYDSEMRYVEAAPAGYPTLLVINPDNMLIWYSGLGWFDDEDLLDAFLLEVCEVSAANDPGYLP